ncbi:glycosyl hydrolase family 18 protein [Cohnella lupini]|uniref:chitinase n=1 Tax=Cohnella lupini TaxID=1294267 RepID=A0A3D9IQ96_9BACL|nr:glycosyl hydrolase family 18 protein [Cohnella lupini]RED63915.1 chitinase [Cohnella lupini]
MKANTTRLRLMLLLIVIGFAALPPQSSHAGNEIKLTYENTRIVFAAPPITLNANTYVETRPFIQPIGLSIEWIDKTQFKLAKPDLTLVMDVNSTLARLNGIQVYLTVPPVLRQGKLFLPVRPMATLLNLNLSWQASTYTISLSPKSSNTIPQPPITEPVPNPSSPYKVIAYYPSWAVYQNYPVSKIAAPSITHINYAFANIQDGQVVMGDPLTDTSNFRELRKLKETNPHLKTLISVGGWTWSGDFSDAALTVYSRNRFADSVVQFLRVNGFNGVDLDWEYPVAGGLASNVTRPEDKRNYTLLLQAVRDKLDAAEAADGKAYLLTIAAGAFTGFANQTEIAKVAATTDWINLMTYDYHGDWESSSNHLAPLYADPADPASAKSNIDSTVKAYIGAKVPADKLILGIPLYGRSWTECGTTNQGLYQSCNGAAPGVIADGVHEYGNLEEQGWINGNGFVRYWNDTAKVPWLYKKTTGTFVTYEDPESIAYKADYIKTKKLGGAMLWEISQDFNGTLLNKLVNSLK